MRRGRFPQARDALLLNTSFWGDQADAIEDGNDRVRTRRSRWCAAIGLFAQRGIELKIHTAERGGLRRGLCWDVSGFFSSERREDTNRRAFQPRCNGRTHAGTECRVHVEITGAVRYV
jgi:hypothetical protein